MNKRELVGTVKDLMGGTNKEAALAVESVLDAIKTGLVEDGKVALVGFGSFETVLRKARTCRNPQNGNTIEVPAKMAPKFKASKLLKEMVQDTFE